MNIDVKKILESNPNLIKSLENYRWIINRCNELKKDGNDIKADVEFQKKFSSFWRINTARNEQQWHKVYYAYFEEVKNKKDLSFDEILFYLKEHIGSLECVFSSKMLATINTDKPIWDNCVKNSLNLPDSKKNFDRAVEIYSKIEEWYKNFLPTQECDEWISVFDSFYPDYKDISKTKKVDFILWLKDKEIAN